MLDKVRLQIAIKSFKFFSFSAISLGFAKESERERQRQSLLRNVEKSPVIIDPMKAPIFQRSLYIYINEREFATSYMYIICTRRSFFFSSSGTLSCYHPLRARAHVCIYMYLCRCICFAFYVYMQTSMCAQCCSCKTEAYLENVTQIYARNDKERGIL